MRSHYQQTMIPIVKNKHGDISSIDNYRAMAHSNILGKMLELFHV